jgi:polar amino acid transport system substrate-binding protein
MRWFLVPLLILLATDVANAAEAPLRVAYVRGNLAQLAQDSATGQYRGVSVDVAQELARQWQRPIAMTMLSPAAVIEAVAKGEADIGFVAPNQERMGPVLFSQTYMLVQQSALVANGSPIASVAELDRPGRRIVANAGDSVAFYLKRTLRQGTLVESTDNTAQEPIAWLRNGTAEAFAGNRQRLGVTMRGTTGLRLLHDNIYAVPQAIAVPRNRPDLLATVDAAISRMRDTGFLEQAVQRSGADGIAVAPAAP